MSQNFFSKFQEKLMTGVHIVQILAYSISFVLIFTSIIKSVCIYVLEYSNPLQAYVDTRLNLGEAVVLSLSFILGAEILKLFYINSYKQLIIVAGLVAIKLLVTYLLSNEIQKSIDKTL